MMRTPAPTPTLFRTLLLAQIPVTTAGGLAEYIVDQVPATVRAAYDAAIGDASTGWLVFAGLSAIALLVMAVVVLVGLYKFRPWARRANLALGALGLVGTALMGYFVQTGIATACYTLAAYLWGATAAMTYFSELSTRFTSENHQSPP